MKITYREIYKRHGCEVLDQCHDEWISICTAISEERAAQIVTALNAQDNLLPITEAEVIRRKGRN